MNVEIAEVFSGDVDLCRLQTSNMKGMKDKPKRPLNAYNFFFQNERKLLLGPDFVEKKEGRRIHRKTHGKFSFGEMARIISKKWKELDETTRSKFEQLAECDRKRYRQQMIIWKTGTKQMKHQQHQEGRRAIQQQQHHIQKQVVADDRVHKKSTNKGTSWSAIINPNAPRDSPSVPNTSRSVQHVVLQATEQKRETNFRGDNTRPTELPNRNTTSLMAFFNDPHNLGTTNGDAAFSSAGVANLFAISGDSTSLRKNFSACTANVCAALTAINIQEFQLGKIKTDLSRRQHLLNFDQWRTTSNLRTRLGKSPQNLSSTHGRKFDLVRLSQTISTSESNGLTRPHNRSLAVGRAVEAAIMPFFYPLHGSTLQEAAIDGGLLGDIKSSLV